jgi:hypothetical protein
MRATKIVMLQIVCIAASCLWSMAPSCLGQQPAAGGEKANSTMKYKWFFAFGYDRTRADADKIKALVDTAAAHGLNGMVLSSFGLDSITTWDAQGIALLKEVADHCQKKGIELIPTGFSAGYGGGALSHDLSFAAALPTTIALKVQGGKIVPAPGGNLLVNGNLEEQTNNQFKGFAFNDQPGVISFADRTAASGKTSVRFENFTANQYGHGRIMQTVALQPGRTYRFSCRIRTEKLEPASGIAVQILSGESTLASVAPTLKPTQDWTEVTLDYMNRDKKEVNIYAGIWGGKSGKFWIGDMTMRESADLSYIPRRDGTPLQLKSGDGRKSYVEGKDYEAIRCLSTLPSVAVLPGSSIREGENLELVCYKIPYIAHSWGKQISLCMSNPGLYDYWKAQAIRLHEIIPYKKFLLAMDEIRNGGGCELCQKSGKSMAQILGDCVAKQNAIFKQIDPGIEVMIWSDMFDPAHNAHNNYYGVVGDYTGSWKYAPKDVTMMCWYYDIRDKSLKFFSEQGFRTIGAGYYDADDLSNPKGWLKSLRATPNAEGIMYTTWEKKYDLLAGFGDLVSAEAK